MYTKDGMFTSDGTWEYKPLLANQIPTDFRVEFLKDSAFPLGIKGSKAVGEPPLLLSASIFTAVRRHLRSALTSAVRALLAAAAQQMIRV